MALKRFFCELCVLEGRLASLFAPQHKSIPNVCMYGRAPEYLSTFFIKRCDVNRYKTTNSQLLNVPLFKTVSGQKTFYYRTVSIWNSLEPFLKLSNNESMNDM